MKKVVIAVPYNSSFAEPVKNGFEQLGFQVVMVDYRFLLGNLKKVGDWPFFLFPGLKLVYYFLINKPNFFKYNVQLLNDYLVYKCAQEKPNLLFVIKGELLTKDTIKKVKSQNIVTICWIVDYMFQDNVWPWFKKIGPLYDVVLQCEIGIVNRVDKLNWKNTRLYMPAAADGALSIDMKKSNEKKYEVVFVGTFNKIRDKYLVRLLKFGLKVWGYQWEKSLVKEAFQGVLSYSDLLDVYSKSKIIIAGNQSVHIAVTNRVFEAASTGSFILMEYNKHIKTLFKVNKEIICYKSPAELEKLVKYYLNYPQKREKIAAKLSNKVMKYHTYKERLSGVLTNLNHKPITISNK